MKSQTRFINSVVAASQADAPQMPWARGARRARSRRARRPRTASIRWLVWRGACPTMRVRTLCTFTSKTSSTRTWLQHCAAVCAKRSTTQCNMLLSMLCVLLWAGMFEMVCTADRLVLTPVLAARQLSRSDKCAYAGCGATTRAAAHAATVTNAHGGRHRARHATSGVRLAAVIGRCSAECIAADNHSGFCGGGQRGT